jgi:hypothetical protein
MPDMRRLNLRSTAFHEAGHAVVAVLKGIRFSMVWLRHRSDADPVPQDVELGQLTRITPINKLGFFGKLDEAKTEAVQAFAGPLAECLAYPGMKPDFQLNKGDVGLAEGLLRIAILPCTVTNDVANFDPAEVNRTLPQIKQMLQECCRAAEMLVQANRVAIEQVAMELLERWELTEEEVRALCN